MRNIIIITVGYSLLIIVISVLPTHAATIQSSQFIIQTNITPTPPPLQSSVQTGFINSQNGKPMRVAVSADFINYGPITPTNPIIRKINISVYPGSALGYQLLAFANHPLRSEASPLKLDDQTIPDTTCDNGSCSQNTPSIWVNPFTFGLGYSFDDVLYKQFADLSKNEPMVAILPQELTIKLNISQNEPLPKNKHYENTFVFLAIPKY